MGMPPHKRYTRDAPAPGTGAGLAGFLVDYERSCFLFHSLSYTHGWLDLYMSTAAV